MSEEEESTETSAKYLEYITHVIQGKRNASIDLSKPYVRAGIFSVYPIFIFLYGLLIVCGILANVILIFTIFRRHLYTNPTHCYVINLALADIIKCIFVLPVTLALMLIENWIFGSFLCYFTPILQDVPSHVTMLTMFMIAVDRYKYLLDPSKVRLPAYVFATGTWLSGICIALPYPIYTTYIDFSRYFKDQLNGVGICVVNLADDSHDYMRSLFFLTYVLPLTGMAYLYIKMARIIEDQQKPMSISRYETSSRGSRCGSSFRNNSRDGRDDLLPTISLYFNEVSYDISQELRTQKYLIMMVTAYGICMCPLTLLSRLANNAVTETYDNTTHFDLTYGCFIWLGFLPTCLTPGIYAAWILSSETKTRFKNYFRFSYRKQRSQTSGEGEDSQVCEITETEERRNSCFSDLNSFNSSHRASEAIIRNRDI